MDLVVSLIARSLEMSNKYRVKPTGYQFWRRSWSRLDIFWPKRAQILCKRVKRAAGNAREGIRTPKDCSTRS
jgi:hypothetical protein